MRLSIRTYLLMLVAAFAVPFLGILSYIIYEHAQRQAADTRNAAHNLAAIIAANASLAMTSNREIMEKLAKRPLIQKMDERQCDPILHEFHEIFPRFTNLFAVSLSGRIVCSAAPQPGGQPVSVADADWFKRAASELRFLAGKPLVGRITKKWVSVLTSPIRNDQGQVVGLIGLPMALTVFDPGISEESTLPGTQFGLLSDEGLLIWRNVELEGAIGKSMLSGEALKNIPQKTKGEFEENGQDGQTRIIVVVPASEGNVYAYVSLSKTAVFADAWRIALNDSVLGIVLLAALSWIAILFAQRIEQPIRSLSDASRAIHDNRTNVRAQPGGPTELANVVEEFNRMVDVRLLREQDLAESRARLSAASDLGRIAYWEYDGGTDLFNFNDRFYTLLRTDAVSAGGKTLSSAEFLKRFADPDEAEKVIGKMRTLSHCQDDISQSCEQECRFRCGDDQTRWFLLHFRCEPDAIGIVRLIGAAQDIHARKLAEEELHKHHNQLELLVQERTGELQATVQELDIIFRNVGIGIVYAKDRNVVRANSELARMTGYRESDLIGLASRKLFATQEAYQAVGQGYAVMATGQTFTIEVPMRRADGTDFLCLLTGTLTDTNDPSSASIWTYRDVTAERVAEEKLTQTMQELEIIFQNAGVGIAYVQNRKVVRVNSAFSKMTGFDESALIGQSTRMYYPSDEAWEAMADAYVALGSGQAVFKREVMMRRADSTDFLCALTGSLVDPADPEKGTIWLHQDITEQRAAEERLAQTLNELEAILDNAWIGVFVTSGERKVVRMNRYCESEVFRCQPGDYIGLSTRSMFFSDEDYDTFTRNVRAASSSNVSVEHLFCRNNGTLFLAKAIGSLLDPADLSKGAIWLISDITEQRVADQKLAQTLNELDAIFTHASVGILYTRDRVIQRCNPRAAEIFGYTQEELIGRPGSCIYPSPESYAELGRAAGPPLAAGETFKTECQFVRKDGSRFWVRTIGKAYDPLDTQRGTIWIMEDVDEARRAQSALAATMSELEAIMSNASVGIAFTREGKIQRYNTKFAEMFNVDDSQFVGLSASVLFQSDEEYQALGRLAFPLLSQGKPFNGEMMAQPLNGKAFCSEVLGYLIDPANPPQGTIWILNDITERRAAEVKLEQTMGELEIIFQNASIGITYLHGRQIARVNAAITHMFGYKAEDLIGKTTRVYYPSDEAYEALAEAYVVLGSGQSVFSREVTMRRADGSDMLCGLTGSLVDSGDPEKGSIWLYQDISEQRAAENMLAKTLNEMEIIFENASIGIVYLVNRRFIRLNKTFETISGYSAAELLGESTRKVYVSEEVFDSFEPVYAALAAGQSVVRVDAVLCKPDGSEVICELTGSLVDSLDPSKGSIWLYQDVTEQKVAEEKLARTLNEMEIIFKTAGVGIVYVVDRRFVRVNKTFEEISGYSAEELIGQTTQVIYASEEVYQHVGSLYPKLASGRPVTESDVRLRRSDGSEVVCQMTGAIVDVNDPERGVIVIYEDITDKQAAAERLARTLSELDIIFNNARVGICFNVDRRFIRVNKTFESMFGWPAAELIGQDTRRFYRTDEAYATVGRMVRELPLGQANLKLDMEMVRADGSDILCEGTCSYVDPLDPAKGLVWLFTDVTELRRAQAALQSARDDAVAKNALIEQQHALVTHTLDQVATLLNNSGQGFLSFGRNLRVEEGFSQECTHIFGRDVLNQPLPELLCYEDSKQRSFLEKTLHLILDSGDDHLRRDAYIGLLPAEYRLGERYCKAEYRLLDNGRMMLILTDITDEKHLTERLAQERLRVEFVVHALESRDELLEVLRDFETFRSRVLPDLLSFERQPQVLLAEVFRHVHTFKSLFAQASLPTIPDVMHDLESRLDRLRDLGNDLDTNAIKRELGSTDLGAALEADLALLLEKLGDEFFSSEREIRVLASKLASLEEEASTLYGSDSRMLGLIRYLRYVPLQSLIEPHFKAAEQLAERQEKLLAPITCSGEAAPVDPDVYGPFCKSLVHLFRNAVDHGIEDADTRLMAEKDETATIRCEVRIEGEQLILTITDDGCGIDVTKIRDKAVKQGKTEALSMSEAEALLLVFADGITTRDSITSISGRGVGLSAVQQELQQLGGAVRVESVIGQGSRFTFTLPYALPVVARATASGYAAARKFLAPLPEIAKTFCETHLKLAVTVDETLHEFTTDTLFDFTAVLSLGDRLNARIGLSIERPLLLEMTRRFEPDFPEAEIEELADSVGAEITNTLVGNATVYFTHLAHHVAMGTPEIVSPQERATKIGTRAFRGFTGRADAGAFMIFCLLTEENPV